MASTQLLKIVVIDGGKADGSANKSKAHNDDGKIKYKDTKIGKMLNWNQNLRKELVETSPTTYMAMSASITMAKQVGRSILNYYVSDIGRQNGDANYQAQLNHRMEQANDIMSSAGGALSGAGAGFMVGGVVGAGIGAVIGVASSGISITFRQMERERAYQHEMFKLNTSQAYSLARANYSAHTGRQR